MLRGLNAANLAVLVGDRLRPTIGASVAIGGFALGLTRATTSQPGRKSFTSLSDLGLIARTPIGVSVLNVASSRPDPTG